MKISQTGKIRIVNHKGLWMVEEKFIESSFFGGTKEYWSAWRVGMGVAQFASKELAMAAIKDTSQPIYYDQNGHRLRKQPNN